MRPNGDKDSPLRVCIVGGGPSGILCARQMLDEGFQPIVYEMSSSLGGLWAYRDHSEEGVPSIMRSTVFNSSKEMCAFSDFPPPKETPNYMQHTKMLEYMRSYADHFGITSKIRLRHEVLRATQAKDYEYTGRWDVVVKDLNGNVERRETFDAVLVASGHHGFPNVPTFKGMEKFKGKIVHTHSLKDAEQFKDRRVAVVGVGTSGLDAAVNASHVAAEVYLSSRGGAWMFRRLGPNGMPNDAALLTRAMDLKTRLVPQCMNLEKPESRFTNYFNHEAYGLRPKNRVNSQRVGVSDVLPSLILSGIVILKRNVVEFAEDGILFESDKEVTKLDAVILATGYKIKFPMLSEDVMPVVDKQVQLYKHVFPPVLKHPTLAIIGLVMGYGSPLPQIELQARWVAQLLAGKCKLPPHPEMYKDIARERAALRRRYGNSYDTTLCVDWMAYTDDLADKIGASPKMLKYFFTDHKLFRALLGPCVPYQFRLEGPHSWTGARDAVLGSQMRMLYPLNSDCTSFQTEKRGFSRFHILLSVIVLFIAFFVYN
ncbi:flavin-containing monooxygenase 5-like [Ixodes scapularis]|uniref:flavin-containing monooxygenase 5-like n=1 Tax=Ixodes scapularis TaxID=6945 RepID=UPI001A9D1E27|nr:flavin-containing monooxygenase 5-like [Ixodes scapularis]